MVSFALITTLAFAASASAGVSIYTELPSGTITPVPRAIATLRAYNTSTLAAPPLPTQMPNLTPTATLYPGGMTNLSAPAKGNFIGFSVELSVANQMLGTNSSRLSAPFLNYIAALKARSGASPPIRVGGNTQEKYKLFLDPFPDYEVIEKTVTDVLLGKTATPGVDISTDLIYAMKNISALIGTDWYFGLPFSTPINTTGIPIVMAFIEKVLGDNLIALQLGNEPDLYGIGNRKRIGPYLIPNLTSEWDGVVTAINAQSDITNKQILLGPSTCCNVDGNWAVDAVISGGFIDHFNDVLKVFSAQHYPQANCEGEDATTQLRYYQFLTHDIVMGSVNQFRAAAAAAIAKGKQFVMFETNTASCGGFPGISDSFGAALWGLDYSMQMVAASYTNALFHFGGQNVSYNAFTPAPGTVSEDKQWTTGPLYYTMLAMAEILGPSNASQVVDLQFNNNNPFTPGYAVYENNNPTKVVLINYMDSQMGTGPGSANYTATIQIAAVNNLPAANPTAVSVRYLAANTVNQKFGITWAGQNMGGYLESDGRLRGDVVTVPVTCDAVKGCQILVPGPGAAVVFLNDAVLSAVSPQPEVFATTTYTGRYPGEPTMDQVVLATSNGRGGQDTPQDGSTSAGGKNAASSRAGSVSALAMLGAFAVGAGVVVRSLVR